MTDTPQRYAWEHDANGKPLARIRPHAMTPLGQDYAKHKAEDLQQTRDSLPDLKSGDSYIDRVWKRINDEIQAQRGKED